MTDSLPKPPSKRKDGKKTTLELGDSFETSGGTRLSITGIKAQTSLHYFRAPDATSVASPEDTYFVLVKVEVTSGQTSQNVRLSLAGDSFSPYTHYFGMPVLRAPVDGTVANIGTPYQAEYNTWELFAVSQQTTIAPAEIRWPLDDEIVSWQIPENDLSILTQPKPEFEVHSFEAQLVDNANIELTAVIENITTTAGVFRAGLNHFAPHFGQPLAISVDEEEVFEWEITLSIPHDTTTSSDESPNVVKYEFSYAGGEKFARVKLN